MLPDSLFSTELPFTGLVAVCMYTLQSLILMFCFFVFSLLACLFLFCFEDLHKVELSTLCLLLACQGRGIVRESSLGYCVPCYSCNVFRVHLITFSFAYLFLLIRSFLTFYFLSFFLFLCRCFWFHYCCQWSLTVTRAYAAFVHHTELPACRSFLQFSHHFS